MAGTDKLLKASCLCGTFRLEISVPEDLLPLKVHVCRCNRCRRSTGSLFVASPTLPRTGWSPDAAMMNKLQGYKSSENLTRYFCSTCGCPTIGKNEGGWEINTGILERLDGLVEFESHIFVEDTLDGGFSDWLLRCHGQPLTRAATWDRELEPGWRHPTTKSLITRSKDRLHAHCDCGGINLYVARPSVTSADTSAPWPDVLVPYHSGPANLNENEPWWLRADKQKFLGGLCTCGSCRLATGCEFTQWAFIPASDISLSADGSIPFSREFGTLKKYRSSKEVTRSFCGTCGATVFWDGDFRPGLLDVAVGLLDAPEGARAESWLEWQTERVSFREATEARATVLVEAVEKDLKAWGKEVQGQQGTAGRFSGKHDGDLQ